GLRKHVFLFFGFIRKYKGLHQTIEAFAQMAKDRDDVSLLICGESFWNTLDNSKWSTKIKTLLFGTAKKLFLSKQDDEQHYRPLELIEQLGIEEECVVFNSFIPNEDVHKYFQVSDCAVLYYLTATPSGIESLSYNFNLPILATKVGHFPETIKDGYNGYLAEDRDIHSMAETMKKYLVQPLPKANVAKIAENLSWENYAMAILAD
ncbi:MAG: glycosyltransferase involved in cell wall biosynthesis, partial [Bacteroidia bacterium]